MSETPQESQTDIGQKRQQSSSEEENNSKRIKQESAVKDEFDGLFSDNPLLDDITISQADVQDNSSVSDPLNLDTLPGIADNISTPGSFSTTPVNVSGQETNTWLGYDSETAKQANSNKSTAQPATVNASSAPTDNSSLIPLSKQTSPNSTEPSNANTNNKADDKFNDIHNDNTDFSVKSNISTNKAYITVHENDENSNVTSTFNIDNNGFKSLSPQTTVPSSVTLVPVGSVNYTPNLNELTGTGTSNVMSNLNTTINNNSSNSNINLNKEKEKDKDGSLPPVDPEKLADVLTAAGIDVRAEQDLLNASRQSRIGKPSYSKPIEPILPFLDPRQLAPFMRKVANENGVRQIFDSEADILQLVSTACENWLSNIVTNSVILSRHRRRVIRAASGRSEISRALKDVATKQKEQEEKRVQKRIALGIDSANDDQQRAGAEETLHRAANATAAMMTSSKKKKYSWMTGGTPGAGSRSNSVIASRGDNGIRYREARQEQGVVLRDLLAALDNEKVGVEKAIVKGYAKLKD